MRASFSEREITRRAVDLFSSAQVGVVGAAANPTMRRYELTVGARIDTAPGMVATSPPIQCRMSADRWSALFPSKKTGAPSRRSE